MRYFVSIFLFVCVLVAANCVSADIHVYDADDQYLGVLLNVNSEDVTIFIPDLQHPIEILTAYDFFNEDADIGYADDHTVYYATSNCTGSAYITDPAEIIFRYGSAKFGYASVSPVQITVASSLDLAGNCTQVDYSGSALPVTEIDSQSIPFTFPIAFPLRYETSREAGAVANIRAFVTRFYQECLNRDPDLAGLNNWATSLQNGTQTGADVARGIVLSYEFTSSGVSDDELVDILYQAFFNRDADAGGKSAWLTQLSGGASRETVLNGFLGSQEFSSLCSQYGITPQ